MFSFLLHLLFTLNVYLLVYYSNLKIKLSFIREKRGTKSSLFNKMLLLVKRESNVFLDDCFMYHLSPSLSLPSLSLHPTSQSLCLSCCFRFSSFGPIYLSFWNLDSIFLFVFVCCLFPFLLSSFCCSFVFVHFIYSQLFELSLRCYWWLEVNAKCFGFSGRETLDILLSITAICNINSLLFLDY